MLAHAGLGSRRACEELILQGRVTVKGQVVRELGTRVDLKTEPVAVDGQKIHAEKLVYFAVNKPRGYVSTNSDPSGRPRVLDILPEIAQRVYTVGRLDEMSVGLILMTNDGELANQLAHPRFGVEKLYRVIVAGTPERDTLNQLTEGIWLAEGKVRAKRVKAIAKKGEATILEMVLAEGKNREVRRMLAKLGHKVMALTRVAVGPITLKGLSPGQYRPLTGREVDLLQRVARGEPVPMPWMLDRKPRPSADRPAGDRPRRDDEPRGGPDDRPRRDDRPRGDRPGGFRRDDGPRASDRRFGPRDRGPRDFRPGGYGGGQNDRPARLPGMFQARGPSGPTRPRDDRRDFAPGPRDRADDRMDRREGPGRDFRPGPPRRDDRRPGGFDRDSRPGSPRGEGVSRFNPRPEGPRRDFRPAPPQGGEGRGFDARSEGPRRDFRPGPPRGGAGGPGRDFRPGPRDERAGSGFDRDPRNDRPGPRRDFRPGPPRGEEGGRDFGPRPQGDRPRFQSGPSPRPRQGFGPGGGGNRRPSGVSFGDTPDRRIIGMEGGGGSGDGRPGPARRQPPRARPGFAPKARPLPKSRRRDDNPGD